MYASDAAKFLDLSSRQFCIYVRSVCFISVLYGMVVAGKLHNVAEKLLCERGRSQSGQRSGNKFVYHDFQYIGGVGIF